MLSGALVVSVAALLVALNANRGAPGPSGNVAAVTIRSAALGRDMPALVFTPASFDPANRYPVLYLFHGRGGDETSCMGGSAVQDGVGVDGIAQGLITEGRIAPSS